LQTGDYRRFAGHFLDWIRHWQWPVLLSVLVHVVLFWPTSMQESAAQNPTLRAKLKNAGVMSQAVPPNDSVVAPQPLKPPVTAPQRTLSTPVRPEVVPTQSEPVAQSPKMQWQLPTNTGVDAGGLREYRIRLAAALLAQLRAGLPAETQGRLEVGVAVSAQGQIEEAMLLRGSGQPSLDAKVLAALRSSTQQLGVPASLAGQRFAVILPIEVGLPLTQEVAR